MLTWSLRSTTVIWSQPFIKTAIGGGTVTAGIINIVDIVATGVSFPASLIFTAMFVAVISCGVRILTVSILLDKSMVLLIGAVRIRKVPRLEVTRVEVAVGFDGHLRTSLRLASGDQVLFPLALNGSDSSVRSVAESLAKELRVELVAPAQ
jgi:hypothetical protein